MQSYQLAEDLGQAFSERSILESSLRAEQQTSGKTRVRISRVNSFVCMPFSTQLMTCTLVSCAYDYHFITNFFACIFYLQEVLGLLRSLYVLSSVDETPVFLRYVS